MSAGEATPSKGQPDGPDPPVVSRRGFSDFRSDTVTRPTPQMRKAMSKAEVGDDVYREDPTVDQLEREVAALMGHEAALFLPSRTMGNLISIMVWCSERGSSFICGEKSHVFLCEEGGASQFGGVSPFPVPNEVDGSLHLGNIEKAILEEQEAASSKVIVIENPVDRCGGRVLPLKYIEEVSDLAHRHDLKLHLDGSRIWNAAVAQGCDVRDIAKHADSITVCLSKGLGAPAGSLLIGSRAFIAKARKLRKALGGAMRQVGVLAAAGLVALKRTLPRLVDDHENARRLAAGVAAIPGIKVDVAGVETNIVMIDVDERVNLTAQAVVAELEKRGVLALTLGPRRLRMVTHYEVSDADVKKAITSLEAIMQPYADLVPPPEHPAAAAAAAAAQPAHAAVEAAGAVEAQGQGQGAGGQQQPGAGATAGAGGEGSKADINRHELYAPPPTVIDTTATTVVPSAPANASGAVEGEATEDVEVFGVSTSDEGFVVVLAQGQEQGQGRRAFKVTVTPTDPMSAGLDVHAAETPEALTILQLLQDIDVGSYLRHDALASLVGVKAGSQVTLRRVVIEQLGSGNKCNFRSRLDVDVGDVSGGAGAHASGNGNATMAGAGNETVMLASAAAADKVVRAEVKSPFQAMALALRYLSEIQAALPELLEFHPGKQTPTVSFDLDSAYEIGRLEKQLQAAIEEGNVAAQARIQRQLSLYSTIDTDDLMPLLPVEQDSTKSAARQPDLVA